MKNYTHLFLFLCLLGTFTACKKDKDPTGGSALDELLEDALTVAADGRGLDYFKLPDSDDYDEIPQDPKNPISKAKVDLGKLLYHETGLALAPKMDVGEATYSCASCHFASAGFQAGRVQGIGDGGVGFGVNGEGRVKATMYQGDSIDVQPIRTPTALNVAYQVNMLWNGQFGATGHNVGTEDRWKVGTPIENNFLGYEGVEIQAIAGLGVHRLVIDSDFLDENAYKPLFDAAFPSVPIPDRYDTERAALAIAAFERTLLANEAPFQKWLDGQKNAMTDAEKRGAVVFFEKANCNSCHSGPALNSMEFHALGMSDLFECPETIFKASAASGENKGRGGFTGVAADEYKFKVPQLYNIGDSPFYGHGSSFRTIKEVIEYKNQAVPQNPNVPSSQLANEFVPQNLSESDINDITAFLSNALRDPNLMRFQPSSLPSGLCTPLNDDMARAELGCN
ncbi:MAG: cytochrome c peroxidase [Bacteroidota bacterium]